MAFSVLVRKLDGWEATVELAAEDSVVALRLKVLSALGKELRPYQLMLATEEKLLKDSMNMETAGLHDGSELYLTVSAAVSVWAEQKGFESFHCHWLREHFLGTPLEAEDWLSSDEVVWHRLQQEEAKREEEMAAASSYGCRLWLREGSQPVGQVRAAAGELIALEIEGWVWNHNHHTAIHQVGLATGLLHLAELFNGVPSRPQRFVWRGTVVAPSKPGAHMLYSFQDLQYSWEDARRNFSKISADGGLSVYPNNFVGWLVVE